MANLDKNIEQHERTQRQISHQYERSWTTLLIVIIKLPATCQKHVLHLPQTITNGYRLLQRIMVCQAWQFAAHQQRP